MEFLPLEVVLVTFSWWHALLVFAFYVVIDVLYAKYIYYASAYRPLASSMAGSGIYVLGALGVLSYAHNWLYLMPLFLGSFSGTWITVEIERRRNESSKSDS